MQYASEDIPPPQVLLCSYIIQNWYNVLNTMDILFLSKRIYMLDRKNKKWKQNRLLTYPTKI